MSTDKKSPFATDMNQRERDRYAAQAEKCAESATKLAKSLRAGDDTTALLHTVMLSLSGNFLNELHDVFAATLPEDERKKYEKDRDAESSLRKAARELALASTGEGDATNGNA